MDFDRRSYLKGAVTTGAIVAGLGGVSTGFGHTNNDDRRANGVPCPAGTTELARYTVEDGSFTLESGDDVLSFEDVSDRGPVRSFSWDSKPIADDESESVADEESGPVVAVLSVRTTAGLELFEGGFEGEVANGPPIREVSVCAPRGGRAVLCELDMDHPPDAYDTEFHLDGDPAYPHVEYSDLEDSDTEDSDDLPSDLRRGVVHVVSDEETTDYAHSMVNVLARTDERIHLSELATVSYDYYEGAHNSGTVPDEVFVTLLTPDDQLKLAVTTVRESVDAEEWQTLDVLDVMGHDVWNVEDISFTDLSTSELSITTAQNLRDDPDQGNVDLLEEFGDATLAGVGFGAGNTLEPTRIDRYFDDLTIEWPNDTDDDDKVHTVTHDFPALLPLTVDDVERQRTLTATHSFQQPELGVSLDDAVPESVKLNTFGPFATPPEPGVAASEVSIEDDSLEVQFGPQGLDEELDDAGFIVSGDFDLPTGTSFFAVGELE